MRYPHPDFSLPDPDRLAFEKRYPQLARPHFGNADVTMCRPMTKMELEQYREYRRRQGMSEMGSVEYKMPF